MSERVILEIIAVIAGFFTLIVTTGRYIIDRVMKMQLARDAVVKASENDVRADVIKDQANIIETQARISASLERVSEVLENHLSTIEKTLATLVMGQSEVRTLVNTHLPEVLKYMAVTSSAIAQLQQVIVLDSDARRPPA